MDNKMRISSEMLAVAIDILSDGLNQEESKQLTADAENVITGLERGAGCSDRHRLLAVNCGNVCTEQVKICEIIQENLPTKPVSVPDVAGRDIEGKIVFAPILSSMRVE